KCDLMESIANHVTTAAEKLRKQNCIAKGIAVSIRTSPFKNGPQYYNSHVINLTTGTSITHKLIMHAFESLNQIYKSGFEYKKAGIMLFDIQPKQYSQLSFFGENDSLQEDHLMRIIDQLNYRSGSGTVKHAACGVNRFWKMLSEMKSPSYSTRWSDLIHI
ncbi:MAG: DUF4113 domain-containing protein, partial [Bdellovibrionales bacterium]|nr:DUF4113 domain-containing protein [Bdellovibrionales bacterium]